VLRTKARALEEQMERRRQTGKEKAKVTGEGLNNSCKCMGEGGRQVLRTKARALEEQMEEGRQTGVEDKGKSIRGTDGKKEADRWKGPQK
jgi:hypothetical protein